MGSAIPSLNDADNASITAFVAGGASSLGLDSELSSAEGSWAMSTCEPPADTGESDSCSAPRGEVPLDVIPALCSELTDCEASLNPSDFSSAFSFAANTSFFLCDLER